jgi:iron complex transport system permease protein
MSVTLDAPSPPPPPPVPDPGAPPRRRVTRAPNGDLVVRTRRLGLSTRLDGRSVAVTLVVLAIALAVFCWSLAVGDFPVPLTDVIGTLVGRGSDDTDFIIRTLRLPRGLVALMVGAAFGLSGAIFQRIARNPLASPDIIGVNAGAAACAVLVIVILHGTSNQVTWGALGGAVATSAAIYVLSYKQGVTGYRLVLVGIGATAMLTSVTSYLMTRAQIYDAQRAMVWLTGSLNGTGWAQVRPLVIALAVLVPVAVLLARHLRILDLGDDAATGLGTRVEGVRSSLLLTGVALAAVAVASAGPIAFVALVSPQIARRLVRGSSAALLPSAAVGALLLVASDLIARRLLAPTELPVGIITAVLGAPYLLLLLARANRIGSAG